MANEYGNITIDGNLTDWTENDRLDFGKGALGGQAGYEVYGKYTGDNYVFALKADSTTIGANTTLWLNTDQNSSTGYKLWGSDSIGGAEYNVNFDINSIPALYTGAAGEIKVSDISYVYDPDQKIVEFAVPISQLQGAPQAVDLLFDINDSVFLPGDYATQKYTVSSPQSLPTRTDLSK